jgi:cbb3-type cytochrome oxidase subunit 3
MTWIIFNSILSVLAAVFVTYKLVFFGDMLNAPERLGMGLMGSAMILTMAILWDYERLGTPFDGWATALFRLGLLLYLAGRLSRHNRHRRANAAQVVAARHWGSKP